VRWLVAACEYLSGAEELKNKCVYRGTVADREGKMKTEMCLLVKNSFQGSRACLKQVCLSMINLSVHQSHRRSVHVCMWVFLPLYRLQDHYSQWHACETEKLLLGMSMAPCVGQKITEYSRVCVFVCDGLMLKDWE